MFTLLPVTNIAPPSAPAVLFLKVDSESVTLLPVRQIVPPLELESPKLIPLLFSHMMLYMVPWLPSQ